MTHHPSIDCMCIYTSSQLVGCLGPHCVTSRYRKPRSRSWFIGGWGRGSSGCLGQKTYWWSGCWRTRVTLITRPARLACGQVSSVFLSSSRGNFWRGWMPPLRSLLPTTVQDDGSLSKYRSTVEYLKALWYLVLAVEALQELIVRTHISVFLEELRLGRVCVLADVRDRFWEEEVENGVVPVEEWAGLQLVEIPLRFYLFMNLPLPLFFAVAILLTKLLINC